MCNFVSVRLIKYQRNFCFICITMMTMQSTYLAWRWCASVWRNYFERDGSAGIALLKLSYPVSISSTKGQRKALTNNLCNWLTVWFCTGCPLISRISSPTCSVAWRWIMPPCMIRATIQRPSSVIFNVMPIGSSVFFWNWTSRTRVTCWSSPPLSVTLSISSPPLR